MHSGYSITTKYEYLMAERLSLLILCDHCNTFGINFRFLNTFHVSVCSFYLFYSVYHDSTSFISAQYSIFVGKIITLVFSAVSS